ncbi:MAG: AAA family ATPase [Lachnospiraceae bacterium]
MTTRTIVTIGRQFGSGGRAVGKKLAEDLGIPYYDKEILSRAAKESGICESLFENHDEKPTNSFLYSLVMDTYSIGYSSMGMQEMPMSQKVFLAQFDTIKKIASEGPCVIVGRCADYALDELDNVVNVFVHAPLDKRTERVAEYENIDMAAARKMALQADKKRASYYNYYSNKKWGEAASYDLSVNTGKIGIFGAVEMIKKYVYMKESNLI